MRPEVRPSRAFVTSRTCLLHFSLDPRSLADLRQSLSELERRQLPFAAAVAVNRTARQVIAHLKSRMEVVFDRPTPFTRNAFELKPAATKQSAEAVIGEKAVQGRRHFLKVQELGGPRGQTGLEKLIASKLPTGGLIRSVIPATGAAFEGARLDRYGNWAAAERNQLLSALGAQRDKATNGSLASRKRARGRASYFVPKQGLAPGVYRRKAAGGVPVRVLKFSADRPVYTERLGFFDGAEEVFRRRIGDNLAEAFAAALRTAR